MKAKKTAVLLAAFFAFLPACLAAKDSYVDFVLGLKYEYDGDFQNAYDSFIKITEEDPSSVEACRHAVSMALRLGKVDKALELGERLVKASPEDSKSWTLYGALNWAAGNSAEAEKDYEKAMQLDPKSPEPVYQMADLLKKSNPVKAVKLLEAFLKTSPESAAKTYYQLGMFQVQKGEFKQAIEKFRLAAKESRFYMEPRYAIAKLYEVQGDTEAAISAYLEMEPLDPENSNINARVGELYLSSGKEKDAQEYFERAKLTDKSNPIASYWLADLLSRKGDVDGAIKNLQESAALGTDPTIWLKMSYLLAKKGEFRKSVENLDAAYKKWPNNEELGYFLALGLDELRETKRALEILAPIVTDKPDYYQARFLYATVCEKLGKVAEAEKHLRVLLDRNPQDPAVLNFIGYMFADRNMKLGEAEEFLNRALVLAPGNGAYMDSLGWVYYRQGKYAEAGEILRQALIQTPKDDTIWQHLGEAYFSLGDYGKAWYCFKYGTWLKSSDATVKRANAAEKKLSKEQLPALYIKYLSATQSGFIQVSGLGRLSAGAGGKNAEFDVILHYNAGKEIFINVMGPMFTPVWKMKMRVAADGAREIEMDSADIPGLAGADLNMLGEAVLSILWDYYSGAVFAGQAECISCGRWGKKEFSVGNYSIKMDGDGVRAQNLSNQKIKVEFSEFRAAGEKAVPAVMDFNFNGLKVQVKLNKIKPLPQPDSVYIP